MTTPTYFGDLPKDDPLRKILDDPETHSLYNHVHEWIMHIFRMQETSSLPAETLINANATLFLTSQYRLILAMKTPDGRMLTDHPAKLNKLVDDMTESINKAIKSNIELAVSKSHGTKH